MVTDRPFTFTEHVRPACLPSKAFKIEPTANCIITGWGKTSYGGENSNELLYTKLPVHDQENCSRQLFNFITKYQICAGGHGPDTCQGDSGGPLVCKVQQGPRSPAHYVLGGVTSWGFGCGVTPGIYTNVPEYIDWILDNGHFQYNPVLEPTTTTTTTPKTTTATTIRPTASPEIQAVKYQKLLQDGCGISKTFSGGTSLDVNGEPMLNVRRILGGEISGVAAFPWQALLDGGSRCGGTLVSLTTVITAAHCIKTQYRNYDDPEMWTIFVGYIDTNNLSNSTGLQKQTPIKIIPHHLYDVRSKSVIKNDHDIALMVAPNPFIYTEYVRPACLPNSTFRVKPKSVCIISGYGVTEFAGRSSPYLLYGHVSISQSLKNW